MRVNIKELQEKKKAVLIPEPPRKIKKQKIEDILKQAQKTNAKPEEITQALRLAIEE